MNSLPIDRIARAIWRSCVKLVNDGGMAIASNVSMSLLLSIFPFLMFIASMVRLYGDPELATATVDLVLGHWPADSAKPIADQITVLLSQSPTEFFSISTLVVLVLASNGVENARDGLNRAYKVKETRSFFWRRVQSAIFVIVGAIGLVTVAFILVGTPFLWRFLVSQIAWLEEFAFLFTFARFGVAVVLLWAILLAMHKLLPDVSRHERRMRWGIGLTIVGILAGSKLFGWYLQSMANYTAVYAGLAGVMIAIVYLYFLAVIILWGAEFNTAYSELRDEEKKRSSRSTVAEFEQP
ncbi:MAG: YihY/virulence factor BrkB family protein [Ahrensia sp.]|nr:YihY/virulence factor BrkB family protein [Ahrensia sp.]